MGQGFLGMEPDQWPPAPKVDPDAPQARQRSRKKPVALIVFWIILGMTLIWFIVTWLIAHALVRA